MRVEALVVVAIIVNIVITFSNAVVRYLTNQDFPWASDVWTILISIITFLGAPAYFRRGSGMAYTALIDQSHGARKQTLEACGLADLPRRVRGRAGRLSGVLRRTTHADAARSSA